MRITAKTGTLDAGEGKKCPPLPFLEVDEDTGRALIGTGMALAYNLADDWAAAEIAAREAAQAEESERIRLAVEQAEADRVAADAAAVEEAARLAADAGAGSEEGAQAASGAETLESGGSEMLDRQAEILSALDLLEDGDLVKTGDRAGKPKVKAIEEIVGFDVTAEEVDAATALKEANV